MPQSCGSPLRTPLTSPRVVLSRLASSCFVLPCLALRNAVTERYDDNSAGIAVSVSISISTSEQQDG